MRPFVENSADSIRAIARTAYQQRDIPALRDAVSELTFRRSSEARRLHEELVPLLEQLQGQTSRPQGNGQFQPSQQWLAGVKAIASQYGVERPTGSCCVYLVLLRGDQAADDFGVYVGETGLSAEERFQNHKQGYKANRYAKRYGVRLLRPFFDHLQGLSREDALSIERDLADALDRAGYWVEGGR